MVRVSREPSPAPCKVIAWLEEPQPPSSTIGRTPSGPWPRRSSSRPRTRRSRSKTGRPAVETTTNPAVEWVPTSPVRAHTTTITATAVTTIISTQYLVLGSGRHLLNRRVIVLPPRQPIHIEVLERRRPTPQSKQLPATTSRYSVLGTQYFDSYFPKRRSAAA